MNPEKNFSSLSLGEPKAIYRLFPEGKEFNWIPRVSLYSEKGFMEMRLYSSIQHWKESNGWKVKSSLPSQDIAPTLGM